MLTALRTQLLSSSFSFLSLSRSYGTPFQIPSISSLLEQLFPRILLAVPKKKVSHSRKAMRAANKGLKDKQNIVNCPACGSPKLAHHLCENCYGFLRKMWRAAKGNDPHTLA
ncbi:ribosomal protein 32 precursor [Moniliophthora roreri MCA 2997]|uniref:Large ribosomal subunit protein bL32m n=1 Tax=Moniliophthora roreri (strain MCA 2997) TaxID=1381753 RepID=V2YB22_MONRO|nr:ribosomal protein 32 precursor [Moniliophthora roreri MCA 2997]KAI3621840.1 ribosomal protein 32 precursor [Moniliophthora roreri]